MGEANHDDPIDELIEAWRQHVEKFVAESRLSGSDPSVQRDARVWGAHDLPAAFHLRDRIQHVLTHDQPPTPEELGQIDDHFRSTTVEDGRLLIGRLLDEDISGRAWWWQRIPTSGPVVDELDKLFGDR